MVKSLKYVFHVVSWTSAHRGLNIIRDFSLHGHKIAHICMEAATVYPLKCGTWALAQESALARAAMVLW